MKIEAFQRMLQQRTENKIKMLDAKLNNMNKILETVVIDHLRKINILLEDSIKKAYLDNQEPFKESIEALNTHINKKSIKMIVDDKSLSPSLEDLYHKIINEIRISKTEIMERDNRNSVHLNNLIVKISDKVSVPMLKDLIRATESIKDYERSILNEARSIKNTQNNFLGRQGFQS